MKPDVRCARCRESYVSDGVRVLPGRSCLECGGLLVRASSPFGNAPPPTADAAEHAHGFMRELADRQRSAYRVDGYS